MCIIRLEMPSKHKKWPVDDMDTDSVISMTRSHDLLVLCGKSDQLKLFGANGVLRSTIALRGLQPDHVSCAVELTPGQYVVTLTHGRRSELIHRVCVVNNEGKILHAYGGFKGSFHPLLDNPSSVAVDKGGFVYVDDEANDRLVVLTSTMEFIQSLPGVFPKSSSSIHRTVKMDNDFGCMYLQFDSNRSDSQLITVFDVIREWDTRNYA